MGKMPSYTKREKRIIQAEHTLAISQSEFHILISKALVRGESQTACDLLHKYPNIASDIFGETTINDPADREEFYPYPILIPTTRYTYKRIMNMVAYLLGKFDAPQQYGIQLSKLIPYRLVFNTYTESFVKDFDADLLWKKFFLELPTLNNIIHLRAIQSLEELADRAADYFNPYGTSTAVNCQYANIQG